MRRVLRVGIVLILATSSPRAGANCARPVGYDAQVSQSNVTIHPVNFGRRGCPDADGMLRQDVASGVVVRIADTCVEDEDGGSRASDPPAYLDECVPPGHYRYGFARPYECQSSACSTDYFVEVAVDAPLSSECKAKGRPTPAASTPWRSDDRICSYGGRIAQGFAGAAIVVAALLSIGAFAVWRMVRRRPAKSG